MINLESKLEVFIITNGRSTFPCSYKSVMNQVGVKFKTTIIENIGWIEANNKILVDCKSKYFLRVDDDMLLHPRAIQYMWHVLENQDKLIAARVFLLWEPYTKRIIRGIKAYNHKISKKIGFHVNKFGKIDKIFRKKVEKSRYRLKTSKSVVGLHSCSTFKEHLRYALLRGEDKGGHFKTKQKLMKKNIGNYKVSLKEQYKTKDKLILKIGKKYKSDFYKFLKDN